MTNLNRLVVTLGCLALAAGPARGQHGHAAGGVSTGSHASASNYASISGGHYNHVPLPYVTSPVYAYPPWAGYGYGVDPYFAGGMTLESQEYYRQMRMAQMGAQTAESVFMADAAQTTSDLNRARMRAMAQDPRPVVAEPVANVSPFANAFSLGKFQWTKAALESRKPSFVAVRGEADQALMAVHSEVLTNGRARPTTVSNARDKLIALNDQAAHTLGPKSLPSFRNLIDKVDRALDQCLRPSSNGSAEGSATIASLTPTEEMAPPTEAPAARRR